MLFACTFWQNRPTHFASLLELQCAAKANHELLGVSRHGDGDEATGGTVTEGQRWRRMDAIGVGRRAMQMSGVWQKNGATARGTKIQGWSLSLDTDSWQLQTQCAQWAK